MRYCLAPSQVTLALERTETADFATFEQSQLVTWETTSQQLEF